MTIPMTTLFIINIICYTATWFKIYTQSKNSQIMNDRSRRRHHRVAKIMMLFVLAFFIQWWSLTLYGVWPLFCDKKPLVLLALGSIFCNLGGVWNAGVYILIRVYKENKNDVTLIESGSVNKKIGVSRV